MAREICIKIRPESCRACQRFFAVNVCKVFPSTEASALYALGEAKGQPVICFAHITNQRGNVENDFEKSEAQGRLDANDRDIGKHLQLG